MTMPQIRPRPAQPPLPSLRRFVSHSQACAALVARVASDLEYSVARRGAASLAVPGGTTPHEFLSLLGYRDLSWPAIHVTLTDERWVPPGDERSNEGLVARTLGSHGRRYHWFPVWRAGLDPGEAVPVLAEESVSLPWPLDVVVLGMGDDGHVASLFPGTGYGFDAAGPQPFVVARGPGGEARVSLTGHALATARAVYVLIRGRAKEASLRAALGSDLPVARLLEARGGDLVFYSSD